MSDEKKLICVAVITSAHGIRGAVKIKSFTEDPADLANYSPLYNADGKKTYEVKILSDKGETLIAEVNGIKTRNDAEMIAGTELYIYRDMLPEVEEDEFYYEDLIGLEARSYQNGQIMGIITAIYNHGAGDMVEVKLNNSGKTELFVFTKENVPEIHIESGYVLVNPPEFEFLGDNDN